MRERSWWMLILVVVAFLFVRLDPRREHLHQNNLGVQSSLRLWLLCNEPSAQCQSVE